MKKNYLELERFYWLKILIDGILLAASFLILYYVKRQNFQIEERFQKYFILLTVAWLITTLFSKKFLLQQGSDYFVQIKPYITSIIALTGLVSLGIYVLGWYNLSRFIVYGTIALFLIFENVFLSFRNFRLWRMGIIKSVPFSLIFFFIELTVISITFVSIYLYRKGTIQLTENYLVLLMGIFFIWFVASLLIHKFDIKMNEKYMNVIFPFWKSEAIIVGMVAYFIFFLSLVAFSRFIILGSLLGFALIENLIVVWYFLKHRPRLSDDDPISLLKVLPIEFQPDVRLSVRPLDKRTPYRVTGSKISSATLPKQLKFVYLNKFPEVYDFLAEHIDLKYIDIHGSAVLYTRNPYNFEILKDKSLYFLLNLRRANDFRRINYNFIRINQKLKKGGIYAGRFEGKNQQRQRYKTTYPLFLARILLFFHFLLFRMLPKIPILKKFYFFITKGRGRAVSVAEILGRLVFCGFEILDQEEIDHQTWFVVKKVKQPNGDKNPSYGLVFKQKRLGKNGKTIYMYKLRTMHPYSEYIHRYMLENYPLDDSGKIKDDFRMTGWGKFLRKFYLDELPMLINWLKRDVKLVGIRPISQSFFNTYPEDLQKLRIKFKSGLIPPYYADMPGNIEEVWQSEREYLKRYVKKPIRTDIAYFFKAMNNIFFHHAKSS
jgi:lipopolysaccharide/colanic/teichoic acid biosynthesis glycosyltransferase